MNPRPTAPPDAAAAVMAEQARMRVELLSRARERDALGWDFQRAGQYEAAFFHWQTADTYRRQAENIMEAV